MQSVALKEYIDDAERLIRSEDLLADITTCEKKTLEEWLKKVQSCFKRLSSAKTAAQKIKKDIATISLAESTLRKLQEYKEALEKNINDTPTTPYVKFASLPPEDEKDEERDKLSEKIYNRLIPLRDNSLTQPRLKELREIEIEWKQLLESTTDISCRQIIKEGLNDCLSLRKQWGMEYDTKSPLPPKPNSKRIFLPTLSDVSSKGIYAQVSVVGCENRRFRNEDGDVMMFFGNGDVIVL